MLAALGVGIFGYPAYTLVDWFICPQHFVPASVLRIGFGVYSLVGFMVFRKVHARNHLLLLYFTVALISFVQMFITLIVGEITYLLTSAIILLVIGSLIPMKLREAIILNLIMFCCLFLVPYLVLGLSPSNQIMGVYGLVTGIVTATISGFISVRTLMMRELQIEAYRELQKKGEELTALADKNKRQAEIAIGALAELADIISSLSELIGKIQHEASQLLASVEEMRAGISEMTKANESIYSNITEVDTVLQDSRRSVVAFGRYEKEEAATRRKKLLEVTSDMMSKVSEIGKISNVVTGIARRTHILALNAGIETATSGSSGGFGVIAGRMREFSEEVKGRTQEIVGLVKALEHTAQVLSHLVVDYDSQSSIAVENFVGGVEEIDSAANSMTIIKQKAESIASASEQQLKAISAMADSAFRLSDMVGELHSLMLRVNEAEKQIKGIV
ncbi:MAG: methyl-accepting chemotaxis protein [Candidatus Hydrothermia bacterium]